VFGAPSLIFGVHFSLYMYTATTTATIPVYPIIRAIFAPPQPLIFFSHSAPLLY
jgi:hypothetical protein